MSHPKHSDLKFHALGRRGWPQTSRIVKKDMGDSGKDERSGGRF